MAKIKLNSIVEEAKACRKAFLKFPVGGYTLHCHHGVIGETLNEPAESRIQYILDAKPEHEQALRLRLFRPISDKKLKMNKKAYADWQKADADWQKARADWLKADADWLKAYADWLKARADWQKADADWLKAHADWLKADADWLKADADRQKAYADWQKAYADWQKADADWLKADADRQKAYADLGNIVHKKFCVKNCPWDGKTIFPKI